MKLVNGRFEIAGELEKILNHETYKVRDLNDNGRVKRLTLYDKEKDEKTIKYLLDNILEISNIDHKSLLKSEHFHIIETVNGKKTNKIFYYLIHDLKDGELLRLNELDLKVEEKLYMLLELMNAIDYLHFKGYVYKYLSPDNIFINKNKKIILRDMGFVSERNIGTSYQTITEHFIAPELYKNMNYSDYSSDYFSIGIMMKYLFLKDYKKSNINKKDFYKNTNFSDEDKRLLLGMISNLTEENPLNRDINLRDYIDIIVEQFNIDYAYDLKTERNKIETEIRLQGRNDEIRKVLENDEILYRGNKIYDGIFIIGEKGIGKSKFIRELDFKLRMEKRQIINLKIDSKEDSNINIKKLLASSVLFASDKLIGKYNLEFDGFLSSVIEEDNENIYFSDFKTKHRLFNRITNYFIELSKEEILYIIIDDIHNSHDEFIYLIKHLMVNLKNKRVVFIVTCLELSMRVDSKLKENLLDWINQDSILKIDLKELNKEDFKKIIESKFGISKEHRELTSFLYKATEGNLFKLNHIIDDLYNKNKLYITDEGYWDISVTNYEDSFIYLEIHDILKKQLDELSEESYEFIRLASIFDKYLVEESIIEIMKLKSHTVKEVIKELLGKEIIKKYSYNGKREYKFNNRELKRMLYHELDRGSKEILHKRVGDVLLEYVRSGKEDILEEMVFQLSKSHRGHIALDVILKEAMDKKKEKNHDSLYLWKLAYKLVDGNKSYEKEYKTLYIIKKLIKIYFVMGEKVDIDFYIQELNRIANIQDNTYYLIKSKYYKGKYLLIKNELEEMELVIGEIFKLSKDHGIFNGNLMGLYLQCKLAFYKNNWDIVYSSSEKLIDLSKEYNFEKYLGGIYNILGATNSNNGYHIEAIDNLKDSIKYYYKDKNIGEVIKPINNLGDIYFKYYYDYTEALKYFKKGYEISRKYELISGVSIFSLNMGEIYLEDLDMDNALKYTKRANEIFNNRKDFRGIFISNINLTRIYIYKDDIKNILNSYMLIDNLANKNKIVDTELQLAYYNFLAKVSGYFGNLEAALKYTKLSKELSMKFNTKEHHKSGLMEIYYNYSMNGYIGKKQKDTIFNIFKKYSRENIKNDVLIILLKICQLGILHNDLSFVKELLYTYKGLKSSIEIEGINLLSRSIENVIDFKIDELRELEAINLEKHSIRTQLNVHFNLAMALKKNKNHRKAIYNLLKCLENILYMVEYIKEPKSRIAFIKSRKGDLIKSKIREIINLEYNKNVDCLNLGDMKNNNIYEYFNIHSIFNNLSSEEIDSIFYSYHGKKKESLQELLFLMGDNFEENLKSILNFLSRETLAEKAYIILYDSEVNEYSIIASYKDQDMKAFDINKLIYLDRDRKGIFINKSSMDLNKVDIFEFLSKESIGVLGAPIGADISNQNMDISNRKINNDKYRGYIYLETQNYINKFNKDNFIKLKSLTKLIYLNIENYMLKDISTTDKLTNTMTRKYFDASLERYLSKSFNRNLEFSLLMIDLDDFKSINDIYGHLMGDKVLKNIGAKLRDSIRITDLLCRYGGDEFIIALLDTNLEEGLKISEKIRKQVEQNKIPGIDRKVTLTVGVSHYPTHGKYKKELIKRGDEALYFAKDQLGKNSVASWNDTLLNESDLEVQENDLSERYIIDKNMASVISKVINLIGEKTDIEEKGTLFLDIILENLMAEEAHLVFINGTKISSALVRVRHPNNSFKTSRYKLNIIHKALSSKKAGCFIDWENYNGINSATGMPKWNSIIYIPLIKKGNIEGIVYLSVPINEKEFNSNDFNLAKLLSNIFLANF